MHQKRDRVQRLVAILVEFRAIELEVMIFSTKKQSKNTPKNRAKTLNKSIDYLINTLHPSHLIYCNESNDVILLCKLPLFQNI